MRVDLTNNLVNTDVNATAAGSKPHRAHHSHVTARENDTASLSSESDTVAALTAKAMQNPEVRQDRVASLKDAIANGKYEIDPSAIAGSILNEEA